MDNLVLVQRKWGLLVAFTRSGYKKELSPLINFSSELLTSCLARPALYNNPLAVLLLPTLVHLKLALVGSCAKHLRNFAISYGSIYFSFGIQFGVIIWIFLPTK